SPPSTPTASTVSSSTTAPAPHNPSSTCTPTCSATSRRTSSLASDDNDTSAQFPAQPERTERIYADGIAMVQLLGPQDRLLRMLEKQHPRVQVMVRGNEITLGGTAADVDAARQLVEELLEMTRSGHDLAPS